MDYCFIIYLMLKLWRSYGLNAPGVAHNSSKYVIGKVCDKCKDFYNKHTVRDVVDSSFASKNGDNFVESAQTARTGNS